MLVSSDCSTTLRVNVLYVDERLDLVHRQTKAHALFLEDQAAFIDRSNQSVVVFRGKSIVELCAVAVLRFSPPSDADAATDAATAMNGSDEQALTCTLGSAVQGQDDFIRSTTKCMQ